LAHTLALLLTLALLPGSASAQEATRTTRESSIVAFNGTYRLVSGQGGIRRAVDAVCGRLDFVTRAIARPILEDRNRAYRQVQLDVDQQTVRFTMGPWGPVRTRFGATATVPNERDETTQVRQMRVGHRLVQTFSTEQGTRRNVLTLSDDGRRLVIDTLITSPRLPIPLRYRLTYERDARTAQHAST